MYLKRIGADGPQFNILPTFFTEEETKQDLKILRHEKRRNCLRPIFVSCRNVYFPSDSNSQKQA